MKKLLVLAALSAMAFGAKAEYTYTLNLSGAQAVYTALACQSPDSKTTVAGYWNDEIQPAFFDKEVANTMFGGETWADNYTAAETLFGNTLGQKFSGNGGSFSFEDKGWQTGGSQAWALLVLTDATVLSPGAAYSVYYGTSSNDGGAITLDPTPIASGHLMTDDSPTPAPEPTSGLLLLLGVAGLALKRKRA